MRTTLSLDDAVLEQARKQALSQHRSLAKYIEAAVRDKLREEVGEPAAPYRGLKTFRGDGLRPGIDLNDSGNLADAMDRP